MAYTKYSLTPANNNAAPPDGAPEGMLPSAVNDTMRDMMAQIRDAGDGIRNGTYTMTAPVITGGSITGVALSGNTLTNPVITGGSINNTPIGASTANTGAFTTLSASSTVSGSGFSAYLASPPAIGGTAAAAGNFTTLGASGVATFSAGTVSAPAITTTGDTNTGIFFPAADTIAFTEGGVESMRIDSAGNVGIGASTIAANSKLSVVGGRSLFTANSEAFSVGVRFASSGADYYYIGASNSTSPDLLFSNAAGSERMRIDSAGNVLVGATSSIYTTAGRGIVEINGSSEAWLGLEIGGTQASYIRATGNNLNIINTRAGDTIFSTSNAERMRIDSSGNLLVGTTSAFGVVGAKVNILATGNQRASVTGNGNVGEYMTNTSGTTAWQPFSFCNNGTSFSQIGSITCSTTATAYNTSSDYRLKENIAPMTGALDVVQQLKPVTYNWKADGSSGQGFIAHELQAVVPDCVTGEKDAVDAEGKPVYQGIDTSFLTATLSAAIQELKAIVDAQALRIAALESN